jgi:hypothetical protein
MLIILLHFNPSKSLLTSWVYRPGIHNNTQEYIIAVRIKDISNVCPELANI